MLVEHMNRVYLCLPLLIDPSLQSRIPLKKFSFEPPAAGDHGAIPLQLSRGFVKFDKEILLEVFEMPDIMSIRSPKQNEQLTQSGVQPRG